MLGAAAWRGYAVLAVSTLARRRASAKGERDAGLSSELADNGE